MLQSTVHLLSIEYDANVQAELTTKEAIEVMSFAHNGAALSACLLHVLFDHRYKPLAVVQSTVSLPLVCDNQTCSLLLGTAQVSCRVKLRA